MKAYRTNAVVVKMPDLEDENSRCELVELCFSNKKRCGTDAYSSVIIRDPFMIFVYSNEQDCFGVVSGDYKIGKHDLKVVLKYFYDSFFFKFLIMIF